MELSDKIQAVSRMQRYILRHLDEEITLDALADAAGYSKYHALRMFKELTGHTVFETIRALRLTKAAKTLQSSDEKVSDVALDNGFDPMMAVPGHGREAGNRSADGRTGTKNGQKSLTLHVFLHFMNPKRFR